jgi:hypothetical protein
MGLRISRMLLTGTWIALTVPCSMARAQTPNARAALARQPDWGTVRDETVRHLRRLI